METRRITTVSELLQYSEFILKALEHIKTRNNETIEPSKTFAILRHRVTWPEFAVWIQFSGVEPVGLGVCGIGEDLYFEPVAYVWLLACYPGAETRDFAKVADKWVKSAGVKKMQACNMNYSEAKSRWLRRQGYKLFCHIYERTL